MLDLFMGDPVYDEQKNVIGRDFGVKNIVALMVVGFIGYSLMSEMKPISGKKKMKAGSDDQPVAAAGPRKKNHTVIKVLGSILLVIISIAAIRAKFAPNYHLHVAA